MATRYGIIDNGKLIKELTSEELNAQGDNLEEFYFSLTGGAKNV